MFWVSIEIRNFLETKWWWLAVGRGHTLYQIKMTFCFGGTMRKFNIVVPATHKPLPSLPHFFPSFFQWSTKCHINFYSKRRKDFTLSSLLTVQSSLLLLPFSQCECEAIPKWTLNGMLQKMKNWKFSFQPHYTVMLPPPAPTPWVD